ncbi:sodium-coupled monocarboxylate transporter 1-like [Brachionus plicatilis]|uniref:Sodium-coupled monocarboxylate transporter 1-like n=1 Tax=Brachionus plicatilis TaxID=10195 RepID=A0A3M7SXW9_BRAPC|nr:sodium-coupled monocarboxylate transporter 1-like [Brachionus plicatilis]
MAEVNFSAIDYAVFAIMLSVSALIGFYFALKDRKKSTIDEFLLGGRKLHIFPVAMSILASFTSAISILGFSQEMYRYGSMYWLIGFSYFLTQPFAAHVYLPLYHKLKITSAYEYLQMRFNQTVRVTASLIFCLQMILYMSIVLYTPSVAIQQVLGVPLWISIFVTGAVCTVYTSVGGIKAVIWTDTFQVLIMFSGLFAIIIKGTASAGGVSQVWNRLYESDRIEFFDFDASPFTRHTFWSLIFGGFFTSLTVYGSNQATIQRYLTMKTVKDAQKALYINLVGTFLILTITCISGLIAYAIYFECDLLTSGKIKKGEQILPYLVIDLLGKLPGAPGLFVACIYSASLSTVSSGLNSLAAVCLKDLLQPYFFKNSLLGESKATLISKLIAALFGLITVGIAYFCQYLSATVLQISLSIFGILGGPLLGVISLGMFCRFANSFGAFCGLVISTAINLWLGIGAVLYNTPPISKPVSIKNCENTLFLDSNKTMIQQDDKFDVTYVYRLSYLWYAALSICVCFVSGIVLSLITGRNKSKEIDERLYFNWSNLICRKKEKKQMEKVHGRTNYGIDLNDELIIEKQLNSYSLDNLQKTDVTRF